MIDNQGIRPDIFVRVSPEEQEALDLLRSAGGVEGTRDLPPETRDRIRNTRDVALDRARNLLKAIRLHAQRSRGETAVASN